MSVAGGGINNDNFKDNNFESLNGVKDDNISTPQNEAAKSLDAANKSLQALLNSDAVVTESDFLPILNEVSNTINSLIDKLALDVPAIPKPAMSFGDPSQVTSISGVISAMERLENGINNKNLTTASLGDIMILVSFMLLTSAQDQKEAQIDMRRLNKDIAASTAMISFELKMESAKATKEASDLEAWGHCVEGIASVASGIAGLATLWIGSIKINKNVASKNIDAKAAQTQQQNLATISRDVQTIVSGIGTIISSIWAKLGAAEKRYLAEKLKIVAEVLDSFKQFVQENASINSQNIRDTQQYMSNVISFVQQVLRNLFEALNAMRANI